MTTTDADRTRTPAEWLQFLWREVLFAGPPAADTRPRWLPVLLLLVAPGLLLYPSRSFHLFEPDEGRYAQIPKEMLDRGEWVVPTLQGEPYLDKPPLMYWLVGLSYRAFGVTESAARLVPAVCVHLTILLVYFIGRKSIGERAAVWAAALLTVAPLYIGVARLLLLDGLLTLCVTASTLCGFEAVRTGTLKRSWWLAAAAASGLGFLTKGPISEILLFPPLIAFAWLGGSSAKVRWPQALGFAAVVAGVNLPWYVAVYLREPAFLGHFFWDHNVMRFLQPFDHLQPVWYYAPILVVGLFPGSLIFAAYMRDVLFPRPRRNESRSAAGGFWLLAGLWCVLFFSVSGSKLPTYILPAVPPLCLALGDYLARSRWNAAVTPRLLVGGCGCLMLAVHTFGVPWYARERSPVGRPGMIDKFVSDPDTPVVTYPRNCDSVAFHANRNDFDQVRSKNLNDLFVAMHHRPRTVILFTHGHSFAAFRDALPESLRVVEAVSMKRTPAGFRPLDKLVGDTPWGLTDVAVVEPAPVARGQKP